MMAAGGFRLPILLKAASLPRSTYYFEAGKPDSDGKNADVIEEIRSIFAENRSRYGVRRIAAELRNRGFAVNHKKVQRLMAKLGLKAITPKAKYRSYMGAVGVVADNVIGRDFEATRPNEKRPRTSRSPTARSGRRIYPPCWTCSGPTSSPGTSPYRPISSRR